MSSRTPPRPRTGGRAPLPVRSAPKSNPMPLILGGVGLLVVVILLVVMSQGGKKPAAAPTPTPAAQPKPAHQAAPTQVAAGAAKAGKTPTKPAPALTQETMQKAATLLDAANALFNEGVKLRTGGDNTGARAKQSEAKDKIDARMAEAKDKFEARMAEAQAKIDSKVSEAQVKVTAQAEQAGTQILKSQHLVAL